MEPWSLWLVDELFYPCLSGEREELKEVMELEFAYCSRKQEVFWSRHEESWAEYCFFHRNACTQKERVQQANKVSLLPPLLSWLWRIKRCFFFQPFHLSFFVPQNHPGISSQLASWASETFSVLPVSVIAVCETWQLTFSDKSAWSIFSNHAICVEGHKALSEHSVNISKRKTNTLC